jgi:hypothetical protein
VRNAGGSVRPLPSTSAEPSTRFTWRDQTSANHNTGKRDTAEWGLDAFDIHIQTPLIATSTHTDFDQYFLAYKEFLKSWRDFFALAIKKGDGVVFDMIVPIEVRSKDASEWIQSQWDKVGASIAEMPAYGTRANWREPTRPPQITERLNLIKDLFNDIVKMGRQLKMGDTSGRFEAGLDALPSPYIGHISSLEEYKQPQKKCDFNF